MESLVSTQWLAAELGAGDLRVVDASYHPLDPARDPAAEFAAAHIARARFLDLATLADAESPLPGMRPSAGAFAERMAALGIGDDTRVVLYDDTKHRTAARAWWLCRSFGMRDVALLDGGLAKWRAEGRPLERGAAAPARATFTPRPDESALRDLAAMRANLASGAEEVADARGAARFTGAEPDPRGLASGHIPHSRSLPYDKLLHPDGTFRDAGELRAAFEEAGIDLARPLVTTCGSGVTAAVLLFAAHLLGKRDVALYDGSWSEWGALPDTPKAVGVAD